MRVEGHNLNGLCIIGSCTKLQPDDYSFENHNVVVAVVVLMLVTVPVSAQYVLMSVLCCSV